MDKNKLFTLILTLLVLSASASSVRAVEVVKTIRLPYDAPIAPLVAYDSYKGAVWVAPYCISGYGLGQVPFYSSTNTIVAISDNDSSVLANITLGGSPAVIAYDSTLDEVYVTDTHSIWVISDVSNSVVATIESNITLGGNPFSMVYDSGKGEIFVISGEGVLVISCTTKQVVASVPLENYPAAQGLTYDSAKGEIYVSYESYDAKKPENYISVISDSNNSVIATIPLGNITSIVGPGAYDSATGEIYLPTNNNTVFVVSDKTHTVVDSIVVPSKHFFGGFSVAYDPVKSVLFASTDGIYIISDRTKSVVETVPAYCQLVVYDSGQNVIIAVGQQSIQFISDASLPDPPPTPTPTPTPSPSPSSFQNPVFLGLGWVQLAILMVMVIIAAAAGVAAFRFLRKDGAQSKHS
jgi:hypothetical protein